MVLVPRDCDIYKGKYFRDIWETSGWPQGKSYWPIDLSGQPTSGGLVAEQFWQGPILGPEQRVRGLGLRLEALRPNFTKKQSAQCPRQGLQPIKFWDKVAWFLVLQNSALDCGALQRWCRYSLVQNSIRICPHLEIKVHNSQTFAFCPTCLFVHSVTCLFKFVGEIFVLLRLWYLG